MRIILIPGLWLDGSAWDAVLPGLRDAGHDPVAVTLPGQGDGAASATLEEQLNAVRAAMSLATAPVLVVGHSAASTLAWMAADRRPELVAKVVFIGGTPSAQGGEYAPWFEVTGGAVPFPGWEAFSGPDADDLDEATRARIAEATHPVPEGVVKGTVNYTNAERHAIPSVEICPEFSPADARAWIHSGQAPELAAMQNLELVDLDSGHWPMYSTPDELARALASIASGNGPIVAS